MTTQDLPPEIPDPVGVDTIPVFGGEVVIQKEEPIPVAEKISPETVEAPVVETAVAEEVTSIDAPAPETKDVEAQIRIFLQAAGLEALTIALEKRAEILGKDEFAARIETTDSYENLLAQSINEYSVEANRILEAIDRIEDTSLFDSKLVRDGKTILNSIIRPRRATGNGRTVSGQDARIDFAIKSGQVKRIPLYNSGIHLDIESPTLTALNNFFTEAHSETNEYGREFGASFFYFNDLLIKEALIKLVLPLVTGSSLKNWNRGGTLLRHIKLTDLKIILIGIASLMFPDGFRFTHVCTNPSGECTHHEDILVDITKFIRHNFMKLSDSNIDHMTNHNESPHEKISEYQTTLGFKKLLRRDNLEFELRVPSVEDYLSYGKKFNAALLKSNFADSTVDVYQSLVFSYYQIYTPWIQTLTLYAEDGTKDIVTSDADVIAHQLLKLQEKDVARTFVKDMDNYIADSDISQIGYPAAPCQKCGYLSTKNNGYFTVDPEHTFFTLSLKKLTPT